MLGPRSCDGRVDERLAKRLAQLLGEALLAALAAGVGPVDPPAVRVERRHHVDHAVAAARDALHDGRGPGAALLAAALGDVPVGRAVRGVAVGLRHGADALVAQRDHELEVAHRGVGAVAVGLVDGEDVGALQDAGLDGLHLVAHPRGDHDERRVGGAGDLELVLADAHGLDEHHVVAARVEHAHDVARAARQTPRCGRAWRATG